MSVVLQPSALLQYNLIGNDSATEGNQVLMEGWDHFNAIPVWAGLLGILMTFARLFVRECIVRKHVKFKEPIEISGKGRGYIAPTPKHNNVRFPEWHYDLDPLLKRPMGLPRWLYRIMMFFLSGRKRVAQSDLELQLMRENLHRQTSLQEQQQEGREEREVKIAEDEDKERRLRIETEELKLTEAQETAARDERLRRQELVLQIRQKKLEVKMLNDELESQYQQGD